MLTLTSLLFSILIATLLILVSVREHENQYRNYVEKSFVALSQNTSEDLVKALASEFTFIDVTSNLLKLDPHESVVAAYVYDKDERLIQAYTGQAGNPELTTSDTLKNHFLGLTNNALLGDGYFYLKQIIGSPDYQLGELHLVVDVDTPIVLARHRMMKNAIPLGVLCALIVAFTFAWILRLQFSTVFALTAFTRKVTKTRDYKARFNIKGQNEISSLATSINKMINTIENELSVSQKKSNQLQSQQDVMERLANFDSLTGLPNRQFIMEFLRVELAQAKREGSDLNIMFFDLDGFKAINDSLGHDSGDSVLEQVAVRLSNNLREGDRLARLGGDEFLLIPHAPENAHSLATIAEKVIQSMKLPFAENGLDLHIGVSIGIASASQASYQLSELISYADIAMYESKKSGKSCYTHFDSNMVKGHLRKLSIANSISSALSEDQFSLVYQPKMNPSGKIVGFEGLLRWQNKELGLVSPAEFIPIAEQGGKIPQITRWVINAVFSDMGRLVKNFGDDIKVSLNLSAIDVIHMSLVDYIVDKSSDYQVRPSDIEVEVTEAAYLECFEETNRFFSSLKKLGSSISLYDFGTGFSSLAYLTQIQVDTLKIDRQFVCGLEDNSRSVLVTQSIIDLAKRLNLSICAEGIETKSQFQRMVGEGCNTLQGYWLSRPIPIDELFKLDVYKLKRDVATFKVQKF